ncbi:MAG: ATP-binding protein [Desulfobacteraceae bacterium]|jgi:PAS domain S-box-containing protein
MTFSLIPIWVVDVGGSFTMIILSGVCAYYAIRLKERDPKNIVWTYLMWVSLALCVFAVSRSLGHIIKQILLISGGELVWIRLQPYSGAVNSLAFMVVGAVTLFFERTWTIYQGIIKDRHALQQAHQELLFLNQNLERLVNERSMALTRSEHKYRRIFEASRDMILSTSGDGHILDLNPSGYKLLGLGEKSDLGPLKMPRYFKNQSDWQRLMKQIKDRGFVPSTEIDLQISDGNLRRVMLSAGLAQEDTGLGRTIHFLIKDIEQQRLMRAQLAQADKLASIGELASGIAHEINNPLGIILGFTQLMMRNQKEDAHLHGDLKTIEKHTRHCKSIVEDLLNFARTSKPKKELCDIHGIIDEVIHFIQQHTNSAEVQITKAFDDDIGLLMLDEKNIKQVLINLIMNARHAVGNRGLITVQTKKDTLFGDVLIEVIDNGSGIEKKNLSRIFDPFFSTKPTGEGTGLGLSVSYGIIKNHGGHIDVASEPGKGSTFTLKLPMPEEQGEGT